MWHLSTKLVIQMHGAYCFGMFLLHITKDVKWYLYNVNKLGKKRVHIVAPLISTAAPVKSGPHDFPSEKRFLLFFAHVKGLGHMFQKQFSCSPILFFCVVISQKWVLARPPLGDRKCKFQRFCPARSDCNNVAHGILSCYKLQGVFS